MRGVWALFAKELREHRGTFAALVVGTALLYAYVLLRVESEAGVLFLAVVPIWTTLLILPVVLLMGFKVEWRGLTHYLLLSLPVSRWVLASVKCLAVLTVGLSVAGIAAAGILLLETPLPTTAALLEIRGMTPRSLMLFGCGQYVVFLVLFTGAAMGAVGVRHAAPRLRSAAVGLFLLLGLSVFFWFIPDFWKMFGGQVGLAWASMLYPLLFGLALLVLGVVLFDRSVDV